MKLPSSIILVSILLSSLACGSSGDEKSGSESGSNKPASTGSSPTEPNPSNPANPSTSPCVSATKALCARACACSTGGGCVIAYGANAVATEEHDSLGDCETFYAVMVCGNASYAAPYATDACKTAIEGASCMDTKSKGKALAFPDTCK